MSYNGSGTFNINTAGQPVVTGTVISSSVFNALTADLATGLSTAITKDGQTTITNNIPFNGYKITNLGAGTASTDAVRLGQLQAGTATAITVTGTDTYTGTMSPALASYTAGNTFSFVVPNTNTTGCTLNIDGQGAKAITRDGSTALIAGDLVAGSEVVVIYDGTRFQVLNSNSKTNFNLSGNLTVAGSATLSGGTANGVAYLNGSKALTTGSALTFDGTYFVLGAAGAFSRVSVKQQAANSAGGFGLEAFADNSRLLQYTDGSAWITNPTVGASGSYLPLAWYQSGTEQMRLTSTGLGIGTSSPSRKLEVNGYARFTDGTVQTEIVNGGGVGYIGTNNNYPLAIQTNAVERARIDSSGNLLVGKASSYSGFKVQTVNGNGYAVENSAGTGQAAWFGAGGNIGLSSGNYAVINGVSGVLFGFNSSEAARIDSSGNLLVGGTSPVLSASNRGNITITGSASSIVSVGTSSSAYTYLYHDATGAEIWNNQNTYLRFGTNNTERARITAAGDLLVGTTTSANTRVIAACASTQDVFRAYSPDGAGNTYSLFAGLHSGTTLAVNITTNGNITNINGSYGTISDAKMKTDIVDAGSQWDDIKSVRFRKFKMKDDASGLVQLGVVAQELEQVSPGLVDEHADRDAEGNDLGTTTKSVKTSVLLIKAAVALQEAMARIEKLEAEVSALKGA